MPYGKISIDPGKEEVVEVTNPERPRKETFSLDVVELQWAAEM